MSWEGVGESENLQSADLQSAIFNLMIRLQSCNSAILLASLLVVAQATPQPAPEPDWSQVREETLRHFQTLVRFDTTDPPGAEEPAAAYLREVLEKEGIPVQVFALEPRRPNVVARLTGSGRKRPLLIMGHTDTVNIDPAKWTFPPFSAVLDGGYIYGRGTLDDKDNVTAALMSMLLLKRLNVPLDRDVIFLAEAGEEGSTQRRHPVHGRTSTLPPSTPSTAWLRPARWFGRAAK